MARGRTNISAEQAQAIEHQRSIERQIQQKMGTRRSWSGTIKCPLCGELMDARVEPEDPRDELSGLAMQVTCRTADCIKFPGEDF